LYCSLFLHDILLRQDSAVMNRLVDQRSPWSTRISKDNIVHVSLADMNNPFNRFTLLLSNNDIILQWLQKVRLIAPDVKWWVCKCIDLHKKTKYCVAAYSAM